MSRSIYRYEVPIDDADHLIGLTDDPLFAAIRDRLEGECHPSLEFWSEIHSDRVSRPRLFRVFGTGASIPEGYQYIGTGQRWHGLVFHLYERLTK